MKLWQKIFIGMLCGLVFGLVFPNIAKHFKILGDLFLALIHMVILPLVFSSIVVGITHIHDPKCLGRVGIKTLLLYFGTTFCAVVIGIVFAAFFTPGGGMNLADQPGSTIIDTSTSATTFLISLIPKNPIQSFVEGNVLQVIIFAAFFGVSIVLCGEKSFALQHLLDALAAIMQKLTFIVMQFAPYGVFGIMAWAVSNFGGFALVSMVKFLITYYGAALFHVVVIFGGLLFLMRIKPLMVLRGSFDALTMAFSTCSSAASLPTALRCATENLKVQPALANFMLPLGTSINMNGAALFQAMSALFICQAYGLILTWPSLLILIAVATFSSLGAAGVPGTGFIMLSVVLTSIGIPIEGLALLAGIDRIREMGSTVINILGDMVCLAVVAKQEKQSVAI